MAGELYLVRGTPLLFADTAQAENVALTLSALATNTGRVSARYDQGTGATPALWEWRLHWQLATNVVGETVEVYCFPSDGTNPDAEVGTADAALAANTRATTPPVGLAVVYQVTTNITMTRSGVILIPQRYFSMGIWNATASAFRTDTGVHGLVMTPLYWQAQA